MHVVASLKPQTKCASMHGLINHYTYSIVAISLCTYRYSAAICMCTSPVVHYVECATKSDRSLHVSLLVYAPRTFQIRPHSCPEKAREERLFSIYH